MEELMSALTKDQRELKRNLLGKEMHRLELALGRDEAPDYADNVTRRINFILGRLKRLPLDHHGDVIQSMKEYVELACTHEALKSQLLEELDRCYAA